MDRKKLLIATISLVRNEEEDRTLRASLTALASLQVPVFITDGGSPESFVSFLKSFPHFTVLSAKGLWPQAKTSIMEAGKAGAGWILYTEPDKLQFFEKHLLQMIAEPETGEKRGVILASRSLEGFATFPSFQQMTEKTINECCEEIIGLDTDYCYGPFLFSSRLIPMLNALPENCGWGWRPFLFAVAHRSGLSVEAYSGHFTCPPEQWEDDAAERLYRMKQLTQNIEGLVLAATLYL